jgi:hypothetical protein
VESLSGSAAVKKEDSARTVQQTNGSGKNKVLFQYTGIYKTKEKRGPFIPLCGGIYQPALVGLLIITKSINMNKEQNQITLTATIYSGSNPGFPKEQKICFTEDKHIKGKSVAMSLTEGMVNEPSIEFYFNTEDLINTLKFLTRDKEKTITINLGSIIKEVTIDGNGVANINDSEITEKVTKILIAAMYNINNKQ